MAGQDYPKRLEAGATQNVNIGGDYIFCKFADRPFTVIMDGSRTKMEAGDKYRPGGFKSFEIENTDTTRPISIVLTIGQGDYSGQIIRGEVSITPILRNADGTVKPDTRYQLGIALVPENTNTTAYTAGDLVKQGAQYQIEATTFIPLGRDQVSFAGPGGYPVSAWRGSGGFTGGWYQVNYDLELIGTGLDNVYSSGGAANTDSGVTSDSGWSPQSGFLASYETWLYETGPDWEKNLVYTAPFNIQTFCFVPWRNSIVLLGETGQIAEISADTMTEIRTGITGFSIGPPGRVRADWAGERLFYSTGDVYYEFDVTTLEHIGNSFVLSLTGGGLCGFVINSKYVFAGENTVTFKFAKVAAVDFTTTPLFSAVRPGCEVVAAMTKPGPIPQLTADITISELKAGAVLGGEVIKAALEYYFKRQAPDDYLDHIYYADMGKDGVGVPIKEISSGNTTFKAAGIVDNFDVMTPGRIKLLIDSELTMGNLL